jgi:hypothetical protein
MLFFAQTGTYSTNDEATRVMDGLIEACSSFSVDEINADSLR